MTKLEKKILDIIVHNDFATCASRGCEVHVGEPIRQIIVLCRTLDEEKVIALLEDSAGFDGRITPQNAAELLCSPDADIWQDEEGA